MDDALTKDGIKYMIARLLENASEAAKESRADKSDMLAAGRRLAYYEMLDILRTELVHHFIDTQTLSTRYLRHCRVGFNRRCHRIASFSRLALTQISGT